MLYKDKESSLEQRSKDLIQRIRNMEIYNSDISSHPKPWQI